MNWLKIITRSGRQSLAKELLEEYLTPDTITKWAADGTNRLLERIENKERLETISANVAKASSLVATLGEAAKDGKVTTEEAADIRYHVTDLVGAAITPAQIDALINRVVKYVP